MLGIWESCKVMRYLLLNLAFMLPVTVFAWYRRRRFAGKIAYAFKALLILLVLTVIFDNCVIFLHDVLYDREYLLGIYFYKAPIEDLAYTIAGLLLVMTLWKNKHETTRH